jgi:hypothetical protein
MKISGDDPITLAFVKQNLDQNHPDGGLFLLPPDKVTVLSRLFSYSVPPELFFDHELLEPVYMC